MTRRPTTRRRVRRDTAMPLGALLAVLSLALSGCGAPTGGDPRVVEPTEVPFGLLSTAPPSAPAPSLDVPSGAVDVFFVDPEGLLVPAYRAAPGSPPTDAVRAAIAALLAGPSTSERAAGLATELGTGTRLDVADVDQRTAVVEVSTLGRPGPAADRLPVAVAQVVLSVTSVPGVDRVRLELDGRPVQAPLPSGELTERPLTAADFASVLRR